MAFNTGSFNSKALNGEAGFTSSVSTPGPVVSIAQEVRALGSTSISVAQNVGYLAAGAAQVSIQQEVLHRSTGTGTIVSIAQAVKSLGSKSIDLEQIVVTVSDPTSFYDRKGFEPRLYIGGVRVPLNQTHGLIELTYTQDDAPQLKFTIIPPTGVQDIRKYRGKSVVLKMREASGISTLFTGKINTPDVMIIDQKIRFNCSLDIEQTVNDNLTRTELNKIGYYNNEVFSKPDTKLRELQDRITTIPSVMNFRKSGDVAVDPIASAASPNYTLTDVDVYRRDISFKFSSGQRHINKVNLKINYTYPRLHHHERGYSATTPATSVCDFLIQGYTPLMRGLVASAVTGSAWPLKGEITYGEIWSAGFYQCGPGFGHVGWATGKCSGNMQNITDSDGNNVLNDGVPQQEFVDSACVDYAPLMCTSAAWTSTTRFTQNINNEYTLTVKAPQSQATDGDKEIDMNFNLSSDYEVGDWESYAAYTTDIPLGLSTRGTSGTNYWIDAQPNQSTFNSSIDIMLNKAKSEILKSHRDDRVIFKRGLWTAIDMWHTIKLNTGRVVAQGRVFSYTHTIDVNTTEAYTTVQLALSRSEGSASDSTLSLPTAPYEAPTYPTSTITLPGHYGEDPATTSGSEAWVGHIANKVKTEYVSGRPNLHKTQYPVSFVVDTPAIGSELRDKSDLSTTASYDVEIPDDTLTIDFTDTYT